MSVCVWRTVGRLTWLNWEWEQIIEAGNRISGSVCFYPMTRPVFVKLWEMKAPVELHLSSGVGCVGGWSRGGWGVGQMRLWSPLTSVLWLCIRTLFAFKETVSCFNKTSLKITALSKGRSLEIFISWIWCFRKIDGVLVCRLDPRGAVGYCCNFQVWGDKALIQD